MKKNVYLVTPEGLKKLKEELLLRSTTKKDELKEVLDDMRSKGDLSENDGFRLAAEDFQNNEAEIVRIKDIIDNAKIVKAKDKNKAEIGDKVVLQDNEGNKKAYTIVGQDEGNSLEGKISYTSPLGAAVLGKGLGAVVVVETPKGKQEYKVVGVE